MKQWLIVFFVCLASGLFAQSNYWVYFNDKPNNIPSVSEKTLVRYAKAGYEARNQDAAVSIEYIKQISGLASVKHRLTSRWLNAISVEVIDQQLIQVIELMPFVKKVTPLKAYSPIARENVIVDFKHTNHNHDSLQVGIDQLNAQFLADRGFFGEGMTIAVIDNGFRDADQLDAFKHVFDQGRVKGYYDFVDNDTTLFDATAGTHGRSVWSFMAADLPGKYLGSAPQANYWLFRTEASAFERQVEEDYWLAAAEMADSVGVDLITTSLGYTTFDGDTNNYTYASMDGNTSIITRAADAAAKRGIFVVSSNGNAGRDSWKYMGAPADGDSVLAVGAVNRNGGIASFSSFGPTFDGRIKPDVLAWGSGAAYITGNDEVGYGSGTSFSAPLTAGLVTCLWQALPDKTANEIRLAIIETASEFNNPSDQGGNGLSNFCAAYKKLGGKFCYLPEIQGPDAFLYAYYNTDLKQIQLTLDLNGSGSGSYFGYSFDGVKLFQRNFSYVNKQGATNFYIPWEVKNQSQKILIIKMMIDGKESVKKLLIHQQ
ncbi:MAG: serine protease AprX [Flavobacteriales bacterium]|jgi:serine protease AprX